LGALALSPERQSAQISKIKNGGLDQYGAGHFEQQQFGTAGVEGVKLQNFSDSNVPGTPFWVHATAPPKISPRTLLNPQASPLIDALSPARAAP